MAKTHDYAIAIFKCGDQPNGYKDGQLIQVLDLNDQTPGFIFHINNRRIFYCKKIPLNRISYYRSKQASNDPITNAKIPSKAICRFNNLPQSEQDKIDNPFGVPDLDYLDESKVDFDSSDLNPSRIDLNSITTGTYTFGSGGDYATWALAAADIGNLTGNIQFTMISNITETASGAVDEDFNNYNFIVTSDNPHYGDYNKGWLLTLNADTEIFNFTPSNVGILELCNLKIYENVNPSGTRAAFRMTTSCKIHDNIVNLGGVDLVGVYITTSGTYHVYNNLIFNSNYYGIHWFSSQTAIIENNTIYDVANGINCNASWTLRNNLIFNTTGSDFLNNSSTIGYNNASSDTSAADGNWSTGSNNITEITAGNEVESTTYTDSDFLKLKRTSLCRDSGVTPTISSNNTGIRGNLRPGFDNSYSIGADEYSSLAETYISVGNTAGVITGDPIGITNF